MIRPLTFFPLVSFLSLFLWLGAGCFIGVCF
jgi:hypothetical protein